MELKMKNKDQNINYKAFIPIGITFIGAGVTFMIAVGAAYMVIGVRKSKDNQNPS